MSSWEWQADRWLRWARTPGHDAYWHYREAFFAAIVPEPGRRTLEVGCGEGRVARDLADRGHRVVAVDASPTGPPSSPGRPCDRLSRHRHRAPSVSLLLDPMARSPLGREPQPGPGDARMTVDRPVITWKYGASLDGRIAAADGSSRWITSPEARADAHRLRAESDAVMVGSGTQRIDDPHLAVRHAVSGRQPLRVVVDTNARTPVTARVLDDAAPTLIAVAEDADTQHLEGRADLVRLPRVERGLDLRALLAALRERGIGSVLLEGGPTLAGSFLAENLIDRVVGYVAPVLIGGGGLSSLGGPGAPSIDRARRLRLVEVERIGPDIRLIAVPADAPRPTVPLFSSGDPTLAEQDDAPTGFGE